MPLSSVLFTTPGPGKQRLADCAVSHQFNFFIGKPKLPGTEDAVGRIQTALRSLKFTVTDPAGVYGKSTADAVFAFKRDHKPKPILGPGQTIPDNIVGIQTIAALDDAMGGKPTPPPGPPTPPKPAPPPKPKPPPPPPKPTDLAWNFFLILKADVAGVINFKLQLTDPDTNEMVEYLTKNINFLNELGTTIDFSRTGKLMFSLGVTHEEIPGCLVGVVLGPAGDGGNILTGKLTVSNAGKDKDVDINTSVNITGTAREKPAAGAFLVISVLQRLAF